MPTLYTAFTMPPERAASPVGAPRSRNLIASADGTRLYVAVGSNSNAAENGIDAEHRARGDLESHTTVAVWDGDCLTLYDSTQGVHVVRTTLASIFGLEPDQVRVIAPHVGGGFGSKGTPHAHEVLVRRAAKMVGGHAVKFALTRQQMFSVVGYRTPTIQRIRLGADRGGTLTAIVHDVIEQTSRFREFAEQTEEVRNSCRSCTFTVSPKATSSWRFEGCSAKGRRRFRLLRSNG